MIVLKSTKDRVLSALQSVADIVERRHTLPTLANCSLSRQTGMTISNGFPESGGGASADVDCDGGDSSGAVSAVAASDDDDDGGDDDGEPARKTRKASKNSILKVGANLRLSIQPLTSDDAGNKMTKQISGKHRDASATDGALPILQNSNLALWRLPTVLAVIPVSRSGWWAGVKAGRYPAPVKLSTRCVAWRSQDIAALIASF